MASPKLPEVILLDALDHQQPEDYSRLPVMSSRVAEFLTLIAERCVSHCDHWASLLAFPDLILYMAVVYTILTCSCASLIRQKYLPSLKEHLYHGPTEMRNSTITLMATIIKRFDPEVEDISDASRSSLQQTNRTLLALISNKHIDENARIRVRVIKCLDMLVEHQKVSADTLGERFDQCFADVAEVAIERIEDCKPTVRKAAMKLMQALLARNHVGGNLDLAPFQDRKEQADNALKQLQLRNAAADAMYAVSDGCQVDTNDSSNAACVVTDGGTTGDSNAEDSEGLENVALLANSAHAVSNGLQKEMELAEAEVRAADYAERLVNTFDRCVTVLERLLKSDEAGDIVEAVTLLQLTRNLGIRKATKSIPNALQLVTVAGQKPEIQKTIVDMFENLYLPQPYNAKKIATALVELLRDSPSESTEKSMSSCLQMAINSDYEFGLHYKAVANELFDRVLRLSCHFAADVPEVSAADLHLRVLHVIATHAPDVCCGKVQKMLDLARNFVGRPFAMLQLRLVQLLILMFSTPQSRSEVNLTDVRKLFARHLVGHATDATSIMLQNTCMGALQRVGIHNPLRIMRLVSKTQLRTAAAALQRQQVASATRVSNSSPANDDSPESQHAFPDITHTARDLQPVVKQERSSTENVDTQTPSAMPRQDTHLSVDMRSGSRAFPQNDGIDEAAQNSAQPQIKSTDRVHAFDHLHLARALLAVGSTTLLHMHIIEERMGQAEAEQLKQTATLKQASDDSLAACVQPQKDNIELIKQGLEAEALVALQPMIRAVTSLCSGEALFRVSRSLRSSALLALMNVMCAFRSVCEDEIHLRLLFTCLGPIRRESVHPGLQLSLMAGLADLLKRWSNIVDPWTWRFFGFIDDHIQPQKHALSILTTLILSAMLKPKGHIYHVCYRLDDADPQVRAAAKRLFEECAKRNTDQGGNLVYKLLPDIISHLLKDSTMVRQPKRFESIMAVLLQHINSDKHHAMLVSSLMERILHQTQPCSARMLLECFKLLKAGISTSKKVFQVVQQDLFRLKWLLHDEEFCFTLKRVLGKCLTTLKRSGKPGEREDAMALMEKLNAETGASGEDAAERPSQLDPMEHDEINPDDTLSQEISQ
eukprot:jgi/Ulvmu1/3183/UM015_0224.1